MCCGDKDTFCRTLTRQGYGVDLSAPFADDGAWALSAFSSQCWAGEHSPYSLEQAFCYEIAFLIQSQKPTTDSEGWYHGPLQCFTVDSVIYKFSRHHLLDTMFPDSDQWKLLPLPMKQKKFILFTFYFASTLCGPPHIYISVSIHGLAHKCNRLRWCFIL